MFDHKGFHQLLMKTDTEVYENRRGQNAIQLTYLTDYTIAIH